MTDIDDSDDLEPPSSDRPRPLERCADDPAAYQLLNLMEELSEDHYMAGWLIDLEFMLFNAAYAGEDFSSLSDGITLNELSQLITLSQRCQGWWMWCSTNRRFVPFDEWLPIYAARYQEASTT